MDPLFPDKIRAIHVEGDATKDKLPTLNSYFTSQPEWDPAAAGKNLPVAEMLCRWIGTIQEYYAQEQVTNIVKVYIIVRTNVYYLLICLFTSLTLNPDILY